MTSFDDVVEDMPIVRKLEVYQGLQQQVSQSSLPFASTSPCPSSTRLTIPHAPFPL